MVKELGYSTIIELRHPLMDTTVRCGKVTAYQVLDGNEWEVRTRAVP